MSLDNTWDWKDSIPKNSYCEWNYKSSDYNMLTSNQIRQNFKELNKKYKYFSQPLFSNETNQAKINMYYCDCDEDKEDMNCQIKFDRGLCESRTRNKMNKLSIGNNNCLNLKNNTINSSFYYINVSTDNNTSVDFCIRANSSPIIANMDIIELKNDTYKISLTNTHNYIGSNHMCGLDYMEICKKHEECVSNNCINHHCQKRDYISNKKMKIIKISENNYSNFNEINFLASSVEKFEIYSKYFDVIYDILFIEKRGGFQIKFSPRENYSNYFIINLSENKSFYLDENERLKVFVKKYDYDGYKTNTTLIIEEMKQLKPIILEIRNETVNSNSSVLDNKSKTKNEMSFVQKIISRLFFFHKN